MLFVHDVFAVMGEHEFEVEDSLREVYLPSVANDDARMLWYFYSTHGAGEAYQIVTITALPDGAAWERYVARLRYGDLATWRAEIESKIYGSRSSLLVEAPWSPLRLRNLDAVPVDPRATQAVSLFREDTLVSSDVLAQVGEPLASPNENDALQVVAAFIPVLSTDRLEVLYRVAPKDRWERDFGEDMGWSDWSGSLTAMLPDGVVSSGRYMRSAPWSPLP